MKGSITRDSVTYEFRDDDHNSNLVIVLISSSTLPDVGGSFSIPKVHAEALWGTIIRGMAREPAKVCRITLLHGRTRVGPPTDEQGKVVDDWGFQGPTLENVLAWHWTYGDTGRIFFATSADAEAAQKKTGWTFFDGNALQAPTLVDDLLPAGGYYFGDWEVQAGP